MSNHKMFVDVITQFHKRPHSYDNFQAVYKQLAAMVTRYNDANCQVYMAMMHHFNLGVPTNFMETMRLLDAAIQQGSTLALGIAFVLGGNPMYSKYRCTSSLSGRYSPQSNTERLLQFHLDHGWDSFALVFLRERQYLIQAQEMGNIVATFYCSLNNQTMLARLAESGYVEALDNLASRGWKQHHRKPDVLFEQAIVRSPKAFYGYGLYLMGLGVYRRSASVADIKRGVDCLMRTEQTLDPNVISVLYNVYTNPTTGLYLYFRNHTPTIQKMCAAINTYVRNVSPLCDQVLVETQAVLRLAMSA
jgi:hypothetical protein